MIGPSRSIHINDIRIKIDFLINMMRNMIQRMMHKNEVERMIREAVESINDKLINVK